MDRDGPQLRAVRQRGWGLRRPRRLAQAEEALSTDAQRHHRRAEILSDLGRSERALDEAIAAIAADPDDADGWFSAARALLAADRDAEALDHAEKGLAREPRASWGLRLRSIALSGLGRDVEALEDAEQAAELAATEWRCFTRLGRAYTAVFRLADADAALARAAELAPEEPDVFAQWARVVWRLGDRDRAETLAREGVACGPESVSALLALADVLTYKRQSNDLEAFALYVRALRIDPSREAVRERIVQTGYSGAYFSVVVVGTVLGLASLCACASPWGAVAAIPLAVVWVVAVVSGVRRGRRKLDEAVEGGAALYRELGRRRVG